MVPRSAIFGGILLVLAGPASAADFQIDNFALDFGAVSIKAPQIAVKGSSLERAAFLALLDGSSGERAASRMAKLDASEISAPELRIEQIVGGQKQVTVYRTVRLAEIRGGRIARGESAGGTVAVTGPANTSAAPGGSISGEILRTSFETIDLTHLARVMTEKAQPGAVETMRPLVARYELDGYRFDLGTGGRIALGKSVGRNLSAKVGDEPLGDILTRITALAQAAEKARAEPGTPPAGFKTEEERRMGLSILSIFDMISYGSGEARDLVMTVPVPPKPDSEPTPGRKPVAGAKPEMADIRINRIAYGEDAPAKSGFALEGLAFAGSGGKGEIASLSYSGFSIGPVIAALREELAKTEGAFEEPDFRRFIPTIGTLRLAGVSIDSPMETRRGGPQAGAPARIGIGAFELKAGDQLNGIPTSLSLTIDNVIAPIVEAPGNTTARDLIAMGFRSVDVSAKLDLAWDAARNEIAIKTLSFGGAGMARFDAKGTLGNVTREVFSSDIALAQVAALGATVRNVEMKLQNLGLFERLLENEARKAKRKPEEMRQQYAMMATLGLSAILGPSEGAKTLATAISRFVARPGTLTVEATAKSASGLGLADVITLTDPTEIFGKIDLKANAQ